MTAHTFLSCDFTSLKCLTISDMTGDNFVTIRVTAEPRPSERHITNHMKGFSLVLSVDNHSALETGHVIGFSAHVIIMFHVLFSTVPLAVGQRRGQGLDIFSCERDCWVGSGPGYLRCPLRGCPHHCDDREYLHVILCH